jgi:hypothetical protein
VNLNGLGVSRPKEGDTSMSRRIPASERTREGLRELIEGRLSSESGRSELVKLATRLIIEEGLEAEVRDDLGREYYEHGCEPGRGHRNGVRAGRLKTAEGFIEYSAPQVTGGVVPFRSELRRHLRGHTEALEDLAIEMLARGLSVRDIEDAFKDETGRLLLSRTAVSELGERLWADYQDFATRDLSEYDIVYLFVDGIAERIRPGQKREPVMAAWGHTSSGGRVLLHLMSGSKEDAETVSAFFQDMRARPGRSLAGDLGRRTRHHQGDRGLLSPLGTPAMPGAPHEEPGGQSARGHLARLQGPRPGGLSGPQPGDRPRSCRWLGQRL